MSYPPPKASGSRPNGHQETTNGTPERSSQAVNGSARAPSAAGSDDMDCEEDEESDDEGEAQVFVHSKSCCKSWTAQLITYCLSFSFPPCPCCVIILPVCFFAPNSRS